MKIRVLGCSGGIGGVHLRTTSLLVDHDVLIDAGTGLADLSIPELAAIDHVFLTHSHLDHIAALPLMIDAVADRRKLPLSVHATAEVIEILRQHIFNWVIWPDFTKIPSFEQPLIRFSQIQVGESVVLQGRSFTPLPADHTVPAVGYRVDSGGGSLVFSGDTGPCEAFWRMLERIDNLKYLLIECAFPNDDESLAQASKHMTPNVLVQALKGMKYQCEIYVTHLKPGQRELTMEQLAADLSSPLLQMLKNNQVFTI